MARASGTIAIKTVFTLAAMACAGAVWAQQTPAQAPPPPQLERIEPSSDVPTTITPNSRQGTKITQSKEGGRVTEVQVTAGGSHYTMKGVRPGSVAEMDAQGSTLRPPQWKVMEFDLNKKKKTDPESAGSDATVNAPPPQTVK